ncbi:unnamed protein product, partial [Rotaria sp. Silwood2]
FDYSKSIRKNLINSEEEFKIIKDNDKSIIRPLSFHDHTDKVIETYFSYLKEDIDHNYSDKCRLNKDKRYENNQICKTNRCHYRKQNLKEKNRYSTKEQRKKQFQRSKISNERFGLFQDNLINSITEDFNLLNRVFLHENQQELKEKPYLAIKYQQESIIEKEKLKKIAELYKINNHLTFQPTHNRTINSTKDNLSTIII